jgi:hypothetical protein
VIFFKFHKSRERRVASYYEVKIYKHLLISIEQERRAKSRLFVSGKKRLIGLYSRSRLSKSFQRTKIDAEESLGSIHFRHHVPTPLLGYTTYRGLAGESGK